ncbi:hypothetical protein DPMN_173639 [Dreissena polymorpha]|uniref:Uncharacterized protein n=1 Tax=Dreissena polymorpha TaxID=45954 RepID=A0A9D4E4N2_DREPO|nr:hypothetical protein DPMN_173639 [Dreissena polymorpha]
MVQNVRMFDTVEGFAVNSLILLVSERKTAEEARNINGAVAVVLYIFGILL